MEYVPSSPMTGGTMMGYLHRRRLPLLRGISMRFYFPRYLSPTPKWNSSTEFQCLFWCEVDILMRTIPGLSKSIKDPTMDYKEMLRGWGFSSAVKRLPSNSKALGSISSSEKKEKKRNIKAALAYIYMLKSIYSGYANVIQLLHPMNYSWFLKLWRAEPGIMKGDKDCSVKEPKKIINSVLLKILSIQLHRRSVLTSEGYAVIKPMFCCIWMKLSMSKIFKGLSKFTHHID